MIKFRITQAQPLKSVFISLVALSLVCGWAGSVVSAPPARAAGAYTLGSFLSSVNPYFALQTSNPLYYVAPGAAGSGDGSSAVNAVSFAGLQALTLQPNTTVFLQRGGTYPGTLALAPGATLSAYGTGNKPIVDATIPSSGLTWTQGAGGIWTAPCAQRVGNIFLGGVEQPVGKRPQSPVTAAGNNTMTVPANAGLGAWAVEAEVVAFSWQWRPLYFRVTAYDAGSGTFTTNRPLAGGLGNFTPAIVEHGLGMVLFNHENLITGDGQWAWRNGTVYYRSPGNVNPNTLALRLATRTVGVNLPANSGGYTITNIEFFGQVQDGIYGKNINNVSLVNCVFRQQLTMGVSLVKDCADISITSCTFDRIGCNGAALGKLTNWNWSNNTSYGIGMQTLPPHNREYDFGPDTRYPDDLGECPGGNFVVSPGTKQGVVQNNVADYMAYHCVSWHNTGDYNGAPATLDISYNRVTNYGLRMGDGAGIYGGAVAAAYAGDVANFDRNVRIHHNHCQTVHTAGNLFSGIYLDNGTELCVVEKNTVAGNPYAGLFSNVGTRRNTFTDNTAFDNVFAQLHVGQATSSNLVAGVGFVVTNNTLVSYSGQPIFDLSREDNAPFDAFGSGGACSGNVLVALDPTNRNVLHTKDYIGNGQYTQTDYGFAAAASFLRQPIGVLDPTVAPQTLLFDMNDSPVSRQAVLPTGYYALTGQLDAPTLEGYEVAVSTSYPPATAVSAPANGSLTNDNTPTFSGTAPAGSTVSVIVDGSSVGTTTADASGNWAFTPTIALTSGSHSVSARAADAAGNTSTISNTNTFTVDTAVPSVAISSAATNPTSISRLLVTVTFSEAVTSFVAGDVTVTNGSISGFSGSGTTYTFNVTPAANGTVTVDVPANVTQDAASNGNTAAPQFNIIFSDVTAWNGSVSIDWYAAANWSNGVPTYSLDATIPAGAPQYPAISASTAFARNLTIAAGATLSQSGGTLDVKGTWTNNGTFTAPGGTVAFTNTSAQTVDGSSLNRFWNLRVGATGSTVSNASLASPATVRRLLTLNGSLTTNGQPFMLESTPALTAMVFNNGGFVNGTSTVQRAIDPTLNPGVGYHHYSSPVVSTTVADLASPGFTPVANPAYNTSPTPANKGPFPNVFGYDQNRLTLTNSMVGFDKGWFSPTALTDVLPQGRGYTVNIAANQTVDFVGSLFTGTLSLPLARNSGATAPDAGWNFVGNPYASPLDWNAVAPADRQNLDASMYVYQTTSQYGGQYRAFVNGIGGDPRIPMAGGFWVRVSTGQTSGTLTLRNSQRLTAYSNVVLQRSTADTRPLVQLDLQGAGHSDPVYVYFENGATTGVDREMDAAKLLNPHGLNVSAEAGTQRLAVNGLPVLGTAMVTVPLTVGVPAAGAYAFHAAQLLNLSTTPVYLRDRQSGALVDLARQPSYAFTVSNASALLTGRFELVFLPQQVLGTASTSFSAQVAVYPNPASKAVFVALPAAEGRGAGRAELVDGLGRVVRTQVLPAAGATAHQLSLVGVATGVYSVRIATPQGVAVKKLVVE